MALIDPPDLGELRALLHSPHDNSQPELWENRLCFQLSLAHQFPDYASRVVPYLASFPALHDRPLWTCRSVEALALARRLVPFGRFRLALSEGELAVEDVAQLREGGLHEVVTALKLRGNDARLQTLFTLGPWPKLTSLDMRVFVTTALLEAMHDAPWAPQLTSFALWPKTGSARCDDLWAALAGLEALEVKGASFDDACFTALCTRGPSKTLRRLSWSYGLSAEGLEALSLSALRTLELSGNALGDGAAMWLASAPLLGGLETLGLDGTGVTSLGMQALRDAPHLGAQVKASLEGAYECGSLAREDEFDLFF